MKKVTVLERSTHSHTLEHEGKVKVVELNQIGGKLVVIEEKQIAKVLHGEHNMLGIEKPVITKVIQQEYNPILNLIQNAGD